LISSYKFLVSTRIAGGLLFRASRSQLAKAVIKSRLGFDMPKEKLRFP
jgi:hypothetical protein